jgi:acetylornithine deacetylase
MPQWQIDADQVTRYLSEMVSIDSVNPGLVPDGAGEGEMAAWLVDTCQSLGLKTRTQETAPGRPNVIARWPGRGSGHSLLLTGHTDVVGVEGMEGEPFVPRIEDGRLYGRGAMDMKGGLAAILGAVAALRGGDFQPEGDLLLGFVTDEEYLSNGTESLVKEVQADAAILTEPSNLQIDIAHKGFAWMTITTQGRAAHGSRYEEGTDAIAHMGRVISAMETMEHETLPQRSHPLLGRPSVHASMVDGGLGWSTYPDRCELKIEHRLLPGESAEALLSAWEKTLAGLAAADPQFAGKVELGFTRPGYEIQQDAPIVATLHAALEEVTGDEPVYSGMTGWLDSAILGAAGIPTVIFGPGGEGLHSAVEYVHLDQVHRCALVLAEAAARWTGSRA